MSDYTQRASSTSPDDYRVGIYTQDFPVWRLRSNLRADWMLGDFGASWTTRYFSGLEEDCLTQRLASGEVVAIGICSDPERRVEAGFEPRNHIGATTYHDVQVRYNTPWNGTVAVGVNNVFDKEPPVANQAFANSFDSQYDTPGQFYYMEYRQRF